MTTWSYKGFELLALNPVLYCRRVDFTYLAYLECCEKGTSWHEAKIALYKFEPIIM